MPKGFTEEQNQQYRSLVRDGHSLAEARLLVQLDQSTSQPFEWHAQPER